MHLEFIPCACFVFLEVNYETCKDSRKQMYEQRWKDRMWRMPIFLPKCM